MTGLTLFLVHTFNRWILPWKCGITEEELRIPLAPVSQKNSSHVGSFFVFYWESRALRSSYSISLLFQGAIYSREVAERLISHWASMLHISQKRNTVFDTLWKNIVTNFFLYSAHIVKFFVKNLVTEQRFHYITPFWNQNQIYCQLGTYLANAQVIFLACWIFCQGATHIATHRKKGVEKLQTMYYIYSIEKALFKKSST